MGPGGDGPVRDVRLVDGFGGLPEGSAPEPQQPGGAGDVQDAERKRVLDSLRGPNRLGGVSDGFGSFQPTPPEPPSKKGKVFFAAIKWFTDGIIETVRETFSLLGLFKPVETFEASTARYFDEMITDADEDIVVIEEFVPEEIGEEDEVVEAMETGGFEVFAPEPLPVGAFVEFAFAL